MMNNKLRDKKQKSVADWLIDIVSVVALIFSLGYYLFYRFCEEEMVSQNFGKKDISIMVLFGEGILIVIGLSILRSCPQQLNYPVEITNNNYKPLYLLARRMLYLAEVVIAICFACFIIAIEANNTECLILLTVLFFSIIMLVLVVGVFKMYSYKENR